MKKFILIIILSIIFINSHAMIAGPRCEYYIIEYFYKNIRDSLFIHGEIPVGIIYGVIDCEVFSKKEESFNEMVKLVERKIYKHLGLINLNQIKILLRKLEESELEEYSLDIFDFNCYSSRFKDRNYRFKKFREIKNNNSFLDLKKIIWQEDNF